MLTTSRILVKEIRMDYQKNRIVLQMQEQNIIYLSMIVMITQMLYFRNINDFGKKIIKITIKMLLNGR